MDSWRVTHNAGAECFSKIQQRLGECGLYQSGADGQQKRCASDLPQQSWHIKGLGSESLNLCLLNIYI